MTDDLAAIRARDERRGELPEQPRIRCAADDAIRGDSDQQVQRDRRTLLRLYDQLAERLKVADEALQQAEYALCRCYDVTEWPANGQSTADHALAAVRAALTSSQGEK